MRVLSPEYKDLATRAGRYPKLRMELYAGTRGAWTDTVEAEYDGENAIVSATYTNGITSAPSRFETGLAFCGALEIELHGIPTEGFTAGKRLKLFSGFYDPEDGKTYETSVGEFFVESVSSDNRKTTVKARDKMMYAEQKFDSLKLTYPCSLLDCVREIFRQMGFTIPEDYTLDINPTVYAPAWTKPLANDGLYKESAKAYYIKDPKGYPITFPGPEGNERVNGHAYLVTGFMLTCREALGSAAKMQLGNCFIDGDGIPRFTSYKSASQIGDNHVTGLTIGEENFTINRVAVNYRGYAEESLELFKRTLTERRGDLMYYTNFPSDYVDNFAPISSRAVGKTFYEGTVERKGLGETEIGEFLDYNGKMGTRRFFVFGVQYEWSGGSFDETIYSFAPDYKGVDYEWLNDQDIIVGEEDEPVKDETPGTSEVPESGLTVNQAVIISEKDAKYLLHSFTELKYNAGSQIGYAGPGNQIVVQGYLAYTWDKLNEGANYVSGTQIHYPSDWTPSVSRYVEITGDFYNNSGTAHYKRAFLALESASAAGERYVLYIEQEDGTQTRLGNFLNKDHWSGVGLALEWIQIYPPGTIYAGITYENGCAAVRIGWFWKSNMTTDYIYDRWYDNAQYRFPFASLAEYQAAVGLTYEPLTLTRVEDNPTVVSGIEIGEEVN